MKRRRDVKPVEATTHHRLSRARRLRWRERHYGRVCLTPREYEAAMREVRLLKPLPAPHEPEADGQRFALQQTIADQMGVSRQWVSELLRNVDDLFSYFVEADVPAQWRWNGRAWWLDAPVGEGVEHLSG
jgi:hypothetical protein